MGFGGKRKRIKCCGVNMRRIPYKQPPYYICNICHKKIIVINKKEIEIKDSIKNMVHFWNRLKGSSVIYNRIDEHGKF